MRLARLATLAVATLVLNALLQVLPVLVLGASGESDALLLILIPSNIVFAVAAGALPNTETPRLAVLEAHSERGFVERQNHWFTLASLAGLLSVLPTPIFLWLDERGAVSALSQSEIAAMLVLAALGCAGSTLGLGIAARLNARGRHHQTALLNVFATLVGVLVSLGTLVTAGPVGATIGLFARGLVFVALSRAVLGGQIPGIGTVAALRAARHLIASNAFFRSEIGLDRVIAATMRPGTLSIYYVITRGFGSASQVVNQVVNVPLVTKLAEQDACPDSAQDERTRRQIREWLLALRLAAAFGLVVFVGGVVTAVIAPQMVTGGAESTVALLPVVFSLGGFAVLSNVGQVAPSMLYAKGLSGTVARRSVIAFVVGATLKLTAAALFGIVGLGLATSAYHAIGVALTVTATFALIKETQ